MSILGNLLGGVFGGNEEKNEPKPCANCLSSCAFFPDACGECAAYKEKLIDALYDVEHLEEYYDRYEVVSAAVTEGTVNCPACGAPNPASAAACEFCGTQLRESSGKIRVASASDIPDPIRLAQDIIFERQEVIQKYEREKSGFLENLTELLSGEEEAALSGRMSTDEVKAVAAEYGVSVSTYLQGLDNGTYLTASAKKKKDEAAAAQAAAAAATAAAAAAYRPSAQNYGSPAQQHRPRQQKPAPPPPSQRRRQEKPAAPPMQHSRPDSFRREEYPSFGRDNRPDNNGRPGSDRNDRPGSAGSMGHSRPAPGFGGRPGSDGRTGDPAPGSRHLPGEKAGPGNRAKPDSSFSPAKAPGRPAPGNKGGKPGGKSGKGR